MSFFFGGLGRRNKEQEFLETGPMTNMSMLLLACAAFAVPTVIPHHHHHFGSNTFVFRSSSRRLGRSSAAQFSWTTLC